ncbi:MAG: hypothetical protein HKN42_14595 [Granulosicoccus sp.]|nr:hypothetical protein [Granulosicoccus sp.]
MISKTAAVVSLTIAASLAGCASMTPPVRPAYTGTDTVNSASKSQLVGIWTVTDLNPYPESGPQSTTIEYREDGTVHGMIIPQGESAEVMGNMRFELDGQWTLTGDTVSHQDIQMNSAGDNPMASLIGKMVNSRPGISGQANIYELSANRMVMVGSDGAAMEYVRQ